MIDNKSKININIRLILLSLFVILILFLISGISAAENPSVKDTNISLEQKATLCLNESKQNLIEMQNENFSILRVNDSLKQLENLYNSQLILKEKKKTTDFSLVIPYCGEIADIKETAYKSRDDLDALKKFYDESTLGLNTTTIDPIITEAEQEMQNERYEKVLPLIDKAYKEIINVKSRQTTMNIFYETTTRNLKTFLNKNKYWIISIIIILLALYFVYRKAIRKWIIQNKIKNLELRKNTLKNMIMDTQKDYFNNGEISEGTFNIKTKKLAELIRDIDRQIPLLQEELAKLEWGKKKNEPTSISKNE